MTPHKLIHSNLLLCLILIVNRLFGNSRAVSALFSVCQKKIKVFISEGFQLQFIKTRVSEGQRRAYNGVLLV